MNDFSRFDALNKRFVTEHAYLLSEAIGLDMEQQGRVFKPSRYGNDIANAYTLRNKSAFKRGIVIGKKLHEKEDLKTGDSLISGSDLAKIVSYVLVNEGGHDWSNVRNHLKKMNGVFGDLEEALKPKGSAIVDQVLKNALTNLRSSRGSIAAQIRAIAEQIEPIENSVNELAVVVDQQKSTILRQSNENTELLKQVERMKSLLERLFNKIQSETNPTLKSQMQEKYDQFEQEANHLLQ